MQYHCHFWAVAYVKGITYAWGLEGDKRTFGFWAYFTKFTYHFSY